MRDASHVESKGCTSRRAARTQRSIGGRKKEELKEIYTYICVCVCEYNKEWLISEGGRICYSSGALSHLLARRNLWRWNLIWRSTAKSDTFLFFSSVSMRFDLNVFHFLCSLQMWCRTPRGRARRTRATRRWNWRRNSTSIAT